MNQVKQLWYGALAVAAVVFLSSSVAVGGGWQ